MTYRASEMRTLPIHAIATPMSDDEETPAGIPVETPPEGLQRSERILYTGLSRLDSPKSTVDPSCWNSLSRYAALRPSAKTVMF